jgi:uncharacterized protein (TIGR04255 family)
MSLVTGSFPQEVLDEVFAHPPIREVAFEIRFAPRLRINAELWRIQDAIVNEYPTVGTESVLQPSGGMVPVNIFQNPSVGRIIKVSQENFVLAFTRYTCFEDFKEEVLTRTRHFCDTFEVTSLQRIGLRYVNHIVVPRSESAAPLLRFVRPVVDFDRVSIDDVDQFVTEVRMRRSGHHVTFRGALLAPLEDGRRVYVLDIDCHSRQQHKASEVPALLDAYHEGVQVVFLEHVTEEYKNIMRGRS